MPSMTRVPLTAHNAFTQWEFSPFALLVLVAVITTAVWYLRAEWAVTVRGRHWSSKRTVSFIAGLVALDAALQSPVATYTMDYFQAHVIQHLLLMVIAPPLLAMGAPMTLALQTSSRRTKVRLLRILNSRPFRVLTHPLPVWILYYVTMFAFFLTVAINFAMLHMWVMDLVNVAFFFASTLFWWPVIAIDPIPHWQMGHGARLASLLIGVPVESFLALALLTDVRPVASMYSLSSTHSGAAILWIGAELFTVLALIPVFVQWVRFEERKAARYDAQRDAELAARSAGSTTLGELPVTEA
jgi:putative copper resistance protein D